MIIQIKGNVAYPITLDPSVWIFDDRKIKLENAFEQRAVENDDMNKDNSKLNKPPVNNSIKKYNKKELLEGSYVMPIKEFIENAEMNRQATEVHLHTSNGINKISLDSLLNALLWFSVDGRQIKEQGPAYLLFNDGSNRDNPIKGIQSIEII